MLYYNTQWHKITYINTKYLTKKEAFFQGFQVLFLTFNCQTPEEEALYQVFFAEDIKYDCDRLCRELKDNRGG